MITTNGSHITNDMPGVAKWYSKCK